MKKILFLCLTVFLISYEKKDIQISQFTEGIYQGYLKTLNNEYWSSISFKNNIFEEIPSGGIMNQKKWFYLNKGAYSFDGAKIRFKTEPNMNVIPAIYPIINELYLDGDFKINYLNKDSICFERGIDSNRIIYSLKRIVNE